MSAACECALQSVRTVCFRSLRTAWFLFAGVLRVGTAIDGKLQRPGL